MEKTPTAPTNRRAQLQAELTFLLDLLGQRVEDLARSAVEAGPEEAVAYLDLLDGIRPHPRKIADVVGTLRQLLCNVVNDADRHRRAWQELARLVEPPEPTKGRTRSEE